MKKLLSLLVIVGTVQVALAQNSARGDGKISGTVIDSSNNQPVEFATIALTNPTDDKPIDGSVCDGKGKFTINKIANGTYKVVISFIGFEAKNIPVTISDKNDNIDLGTISISPKAEVLKEVTVEGQKALIEERVDRTVYNAENDVTTRGGDATDVLKRVPLLSVDLDGNLSLRGNSNVKVLINNRPSTITASSVADALKQIPADEIKSVEVITSPSAKYDAEGSAGIVNINTKKNILEGATLNVNTGAGLRGSNLGLNGAYKKGKLGISLGGFGRASYNVKGSFDNRQTTTSGDTTITNIQTADTRSNFLFGRYTLGLDYDINKNNYINASVQFGTRNMKSFQDDLITRTYNESDALIRSSLRDVDVLNNSNSIDVNFGITHLYKKPQQEISLLALYSRDFRTNNFVNNNLDESSKESLDRTKNINDSFNQEIAVQLDYQTPLGKTQMLEFGAKDIMRKVLSDYKYFFDDGSGTFVPSGDKNLSNKFNYDQNISAGYVSYTLSVGNYSIKSGARYEHTTIDAHFQDEQKVDIPSYGVLVPSVNLSRKLKNGNMVKASFNRRIQRPSIRFLNPNLQQTNQLNQTIGNPDLDPEYTNNYELSYSTFVKGSMLNFSTFVRNTNNAIQSIRTIKGDTILTTYQNIGKENAYGASLFVNVNLGKFTLNGGTDVYYAVLNNNVQDTDYRASNEGWVASYRVFGNYDLTKGWGFQFFGFYRGRRVELQGTQGGFGIYSLGIKKDIGPDKRGSLGFGAENFLTSGFKIKSEVNSPTISSRNVNVMHNMNFKINFSYRIGKISADNASRRRKKTISNDDLKQGDDNGGQGGDIQQPQQQQRGGGNWQGPSSAARPQAKEKTESTVPDSLAVDATGTWTYTLDSPQGGNGTFVIKKEGDTLTGTVKSNRMPSERPLSSISVKGNELSFTYEVTFGGNTVTIETTGTITENEFSGTMNFGQFRSVPITAKRGE